MTTTTSDEREGFSILRHETDAPECGTGPQNSKSDSVDGSKNDEYLPPPLLPESISIASVDGVDTTMGLQGVSPGTGQGPYAEDFRSPWSHAQQSARMAVDESVGSVFDETSPARSRGGRDGSISPCAVSIRTTSSLCAGEEGKNTISATVGAWDEGEGEQKGGEESGHGGHELDDEDESDGGGRQRPAFDLLGEEGQGDCGGATADAAAAADHAKALTFMEAAGSATRYTGKGGRRKR